MGAITVVLSHVCGAICKPKREMISC